MTLVLLPGSLPLCVTGLFPAGPRIMSAWGFGGPIPAIPPQTIGLIVLRYLLRIGWPSLALAGVVVTTTPLVGWLVFSVLRNANREGWLCVLAIILVLIIAPLVGSLVLGPVNRAAGRLQAPTRFLLPDFMWLLVQLQLALGYCVSFVGIDQPAFFILLLSFLALASVMMWAGAVSFLSRAGVRNSLRRGIFIVLLLPLTLALMIATPLLPIVSYVVESDRTWVEQLFRLTKSLPSRAGFILLMTGAIGLPAIGFAVHWAARWVVGPTTLAKVTPLIEQPAT